MERRRIAALALLERISRHEIEEKTREFAALRARMAGLERERDRLLGSLREDAHVTTIEAAPYLGDYIRSVRAQAAQMEAEIAQLSPRAEQLETFMREKFGEMKTYETVRLSKELGLRHERVRREAAEADELVLQRWNR
ncbi:MAG: flagellar FliJ family protein [Paracoccaceae bacterium]